MTGVALQFDRSTVPHGDHDAAGVRTIVRTDGTNDGRFDRIHGKVLDGYKSGCLRFRARAKLRSGHTDLNSPDTDLSRKPPILPWEIFLT
jgi:hypothetical protein